MLKSNMMLNERGNAILQQACNRSEMVQEIGHRVFKDGSIEPFQRNVLVPVECQVEAIDWQCYQYVLPTDAFFEFVQATSQNGPMNFAYLALKDENGDVIKESLWKDSEIEASEERFAANLDSGVTAVVED